jgi:DNA-binding NtrC family response regulator
MARILIVDDQEQIRKILTVLLRDQGHRVESRGSAEEALELQSELEPELVLLDLKLPGMQGNEALEKLLAATPVPDVVIMTAYASIRSAVEAMRAGAFDYITKPFDNDELLLLVDRVLEVRRLHQEVDDLRTELETRYGFREIIGISRPMQEVFRVMAKVAQVDATLLVYGESGTGKELVAKAVHRRSQRGEGPFIAVNCGAIPQTLIESEFFGHERGAFTDARETRPGSFERASGGTLFLDEIAELPLDAQAKLLRALQEGQITRLGGRRPIEVDVRVLAATHRDLEAMVREGRFREDLFWRINVVSLTLPPLRKREQDLPLLIDHLLDRISRELGVEVGTIQEPARRLLLEYDWPGNVRELENVLTRALVLCEGDELTAADLPARIRRDALGPGEAEMGDLEDLDLAEAVRQASERVERAMIRTHLETHDGNRTATAESLGISRKTLFNKMRQYDLDPGGSKA